jgi:hypothetical protein
MPSDDIIGGALNASLGSRVGLAYPKRPAFFAHRFVRLLTKTAAANDLGPQACWLLTVVAMTEDARRYAGPVTYYNQQLLSVVGLGSVDALDRIRAKCIEAGWLRYIPGGRRAGRYWVTIPECYADTPDTPIDESSSDDTIFRSGAEQTAEQSAEQSADNPRNLLPVPSPNPVTAVVTADQTPEKRGKRNKAPKKPRERCPLFDALADVTGSDPSVSGSHVAKLRHALASADPPYTADDVREFSRRFRELLPWATPDEHPRPSLGIIGKYIGHIRAAARPPTNPPTMRTPADNPMLHPSPMQEEFCEHAP